MRKVGVERVSARSLELETYLKHGVTYGGTPNTIFAKFASAKSSKSAIPH